MNAPVGEVPHEQFRNLHEQTAAVMEQINGQDFENSILVLAKIGGTPIEGTTEQPIRFSVNRLALSPDDHLAREAYIEPLMQSAGMETHSHPLGLIGRLPGRNPELPPLVVMSHTDSVPEADMYDGDVGVLGALHVVHAMQETNVQPERDIYVISLTGEESSRFGFALFGSRGMFHGLTDRELDACMPGEQSIREVLGAEATEQVKEPIVGEGRLIPTPYAVLELHVEQDSVLEKTNVDLGVVDNIAAPTRYSVKFGKEPLEIDNSEKPHAREFTITVAGKADHSGGTPMGNENRADGLVETAEVLMRLFDNGTPLDMGDIVIKAGALNKIPGETAVTIRLSGDDPHTVTGRLAAVQDAIALRNQWLGTYGERFDKDPITVHEVNQGTGRYFKSTEVWPRQQEALRAILDIPRTIGTGFAAQGVVGTVGTYDVSSDGLITLGMDIRGIVKQPKENVITYLKQHAADSITEEADKADFGEPRPGSGDPVAMDPQLVQLAVSTIHDFSIGSVQIMPSKAGHDAQNAAKAGIPTVMVFVPSHEGIAHNPTAYTSPESLQQGVRALAGLMMRLAV